MFNNLIPWVLAVLCLLAIIAAWRVFQGIARVVVILIVIALVIVVGVVV
jgi:hypothetical protein